MSAHLDGWILATVEGKTWLGKPPDGWGAQKAHRSEAEADAYLAQWHQAPVRLEPGYEFFFVNAPTPQGMMAVPQLKHPFGCISLESITLPRPGIWVALDALSRDERAIFDQIVHQYQKSLRAARLQASNIALVPAGTKLPPMPQPGGNGRRG